MSSPAGPQARALDAAWAAAFGAPAPFRLVDELTRDGWTPQVVEQLRALVDTAVERRTGAARSPQVSGRRDRLAVLLARTAHTLMLMAPIAVPHTLDWLRVLATDPEWRAVDRPGGLVYAAPGSHRPLEQWVGGVPHRLAPLAHAAGLTAAEATVQHRAGALDEDDLRTLAALRGHRPPSDPP